MGDIIHSSISSYFIVNKFWHHFKGLNVFFKENCSCDVEKR